MRKQPPVKIALLGFDGSQQASLELFLSRHVDGFELVPEKVAEALIVNGDQPQSPEKLQQDYREHYAKPGLLISIQDQRWTGLVTVLKPYTTETLKDGLKTLSQQLAMGSQSPVEHPPTDEYLQQVLSDYRASVHKSEGYEQEVAAAQDKQDRRKRFQQGVVERKRRAEQIAMENAPAYQPANSWAELLAEQPAKTVSHGSFEADILSMTEEVIAEQDPVTQLETSSAQRKIGVPLLLDPSVQDVQDCCGNLPDFDLRDQAQRRHLFFNPEGQLLAMAIQARERGQREQHPQMIVGLPNQQLQYQPVTDSFASTLDYDVLLPMAQVRFRFGELQLQSLSTDEEAEETSAMSLFNAEQLLWKLACYSSKGRLQDGLSLENRYQLDAELPSNVIIDLPRTSAIIRQWQAEPMNAVELMERLHVEQRFVFPFMTAAHCLGWLH